MSTLATTTARMFPAFTSLWEDLLNKDLLEWDGDLTASTPSVNVRETDKDFRIELAAPGMKKDDFNIELQNNVLTISTEKKEQKEEKLEGKFLRREYSYRAFQRSFALPENTKYKSEQKIRGSHYHIHENPGEIICQYFPVKSLFAEGFFIFSQNVGIFIISLFGLHVVICNFAP
jgi:HSP20 family protein